MAMEGEDMTCHFNPPSISHVVRPAPAPRVGQVMVQSFCGFPVVQAGQWCGKFSPLAKIAQ